MIKRNEIENINSNYRLMTLMGIAFRTSDVLSRENLESFVDMVPISWIAKIKTMTVFSILIVNLIQSP
jgi:hypothetical protein